MLQNSLNSAKEKGSNNMDGKIGREIEIIRVDEGSSGTRPMTLGPRSLAALEPNHPKEL